MFPAGESLPSPEASLGCRAAGEQPGGMGYSAGPCAPTGTWGVGTAQQGIHPYVPLCAHRSESVSERVSHPPRRPLQLYIPAAKIKLIPTPAAVAISAPGRVYRVFVTFMDMKYTDMV